MGMYRGAALQSELVHSSTRPTYKMKTTGADGIVVPGVSKSGPKFSTGV